MLYAFQPDNKTTVVAAHNYQSDLTKWFETLKGEHYTDARETDFMERLSDPVYSRFGGPVYVFEHMDEAQQKLFEAAHNLLVGSIARAVDRNRDMVNRGLPDPYDPEDTRTIAEIEGLTEENDKWDERTEEEKAQDAEMKKMMDELRKKGEATEDSFTPVQKVKAGQDRMRITDVRTKAKADGSVDLDNILANKEGEVDVQVNAVLTVEVNGQTLTADVQWKGTTLYGSQDLVTDIWVDQNYGNPSTYKATVVTIDGTQNSMVLFNPLITNIHSMMPYKDPEETAAQEERREAAREINRDFLFTVGQYDPVVDGVVIAVVRKDFFAEYKTISGQGLNGEAKLPPGFPEEFASILTAREKDDTDEVTATMLAWGFEQLKEFDDVMAEAWASK